MNSLSRACFDLNYSTLMFNCTLERVDASMLIQLMSLNQFTK